MLSLMRQPVWNTEWTLNAPRTNASAPFPRATDVTSDSISLEDPRLLTDLASSHPDRVVRRRRVDVTCSAAATLIWFNSPASNRVVRRVTYAYHPSLKIRGLHNYVSMRIHAVDESPVISNKRFMWFLLYGGLNVHAVITLK